MAIENTDGNFSTKNSALAAYLYMEGPSVFIFETNSRLPQCVHNFQIAKVEGNLVLFHEAYRKCLRMTKVGKL